MHSLLRSDCFCIVRIYNCPVYTVICNRNLSFKMTKDKWFNVKSFVQFKNMTLDCFERDLLVQDIIEFFKENYKCSPIRIIDNEKYYHPFLLLRLIFSVSDELVMLYLSQLVLMIHFS